MFNPNQNLRLIHASQRLMYPQRSPTQPQSVIGGLSDFVPMLTNTMMQFMPLFMLMGMGSTMVAGMAAPIYYPDKEVVPELNEVATEGD